MKELVGITDVPELYRRQGYVRAMLDLLNIELEGVEDEATDAVQA